MYIKLSLTTVFCNSAISQLNRVSILPSKDTIGNIYIE